MEEEGAFRKKRNMKWGGEGSSFSSQKQQQHAQKEKGNPMEDCKKSVCSTKVNAFKLLTADVRVPTNGGSEGEEAVVCPLDRQELGMHSWSLLHTMAANYPDEPSAMHQLAAGNLVKALTVLYPCEVCADHFTGTSSDSPPRVESR